MLGTGYPIESFRPVIRVRPESTRKLSLHEFGNTDPTWLMVEAKQKKLDHMIHGKWNWLVTLKAAASRFAAMLF